MAKSKNIITTGTRKRSVARATLMPGKGKVKINGQLLEVYEPVLARLRMQEPILIAGDFAKEVNINVNVYGGGVMSSADASRLAIAKALVQHSGKTSKLKEKYINYDRQLIVADVRFKEPCKPNVSKARKKRQKSYR